MLMRWHTQKPNVNSLPQDTYFSWTCGNTADFINEPKCNCIYNLLLYIMYALLKMYGKKNCLAFFTFYFFCLNWLLSGIMHMNHGKHLIKIEHKGKACPEETTVTKHTVDHSHLLYPSRTFIGLFYKQSKTSTRLKSSVLGESDMFLHLSIRWRIWQIEILLKEIQMELFRSCFEFKPFLFFQLSTYGYTDDLWM